MTNNGLMEKYKAGMEKYSCPEIRDGFARCPGNHFLPGGGTLKYNEGRVYYFLTAKNPAVEAKPGWLMDVDGGDINFLKRGFEDGTALDGGLPELFSYMNFCRGYGDAQIENGRGEYLCLEKGEWAVFARGRSGMPVAMNSAYNPGKEAAVIASRVPKDGPVIFIGAGMGWHIRSYMSLNPSAQCALFEPHDYLYGIIKDKFSAGLKRVTDRTQLAGFLARGFVPFILPALGQSENEYSAAFNSFCSRTVPAIKISGRKPKVTVVSPIYGGSYDMALYAAGAFLKAGCGTKLVDASGYYPEFRKFKDMDGGAALLNKYVDTVMEEVYRKVVESGPDIVFGMAQAPLSGSALARLRKSGIAAAYWFVEDYKFITYWERIHKLYDWFFVIQDGEFVKKLRERGGNPAFIPVAAPDLDTGGLLQDSIYRSLASFVGAPYRNRIKIMEELSDLDVSIYGEGWDRAKAAESVLKMVRIGDRRITGAQVRSIYANSKININMHSSSFHDGIEQGGDFINPRTFEILSCGGFEITDNRTGLEKYLTPGKEIEVYSTVGELKEKIKYYEANPEAACIIARNGRERTIREHTYLNRINSMLEIMQK